MLGSTFLEGHHLRTHVLKGRVTGRPSPHTFSWLLAPGELLPLPTETPTPAQPPDPHHRHQDTPSPVVDDVGDDGGEEAEQQHGCAGVHGRVQHLRSALCLAGEPTELLHSTAQPIRPHGTLPVPLTHPTTLLQPPHSPPRQHSHLAARPAPTMSTATLLRCRQCREVTLGSRAASWHPSALQPPMPPSTSKFQYAATGSVPSPGCRRDTATGSDRFSTPQPSAATEKPGQQDR